MFGSLVGGASEFITLDDFVIPVIRRMTASICDSLPGVSFNITLFGDFTTPNILQSTMIRPSTCKRVKFY